MKNEILKSVAAFLSVAIMSVTVGCGGSSDFKMVPVSGTITMDGKPLAGYQVNYFPQQTEGTALVGPFSSAITDEQGKYSLTNRYGDPGAVVGPHRVSVKLEGVDMEEVAGQEQEVRDLIEDAKDGDAVSKAELPEAKELLAKLRKKASRGGITIPAKYSLQSELVVTVPAGGTDTANLDLSSK